MASTSGPSRPGLLLEILTGEKVVYSGEADVVVAPGVDGELGILPHHAPLLTLLQPGELLVKHGEEEVSMAISGGFLEVMRDRVIVLAETAERAEEIDIARAEEARRRAEELRAHTQQQPADLARAEAALRRSQVRLKVARRRARERDLGQ